MGADELLERADLAGLRVIGAVDHDVGAVGETRRARDVPRRARAERRQRIDPCDNARAEPALAGRAEHDVLAGGVAHEQEADAGVAAQPVQQLRVGGVDRLAGDAAGPAREADQPEVARRHDDDLRRRLMGSVGRAAVVVRRRHRPLSAGQRLAAGPRRRARRRLGEPRAQPSQGLVVGRRPGRDRAAPAGLRHDRLERRPVALAERRALRLAVVAEHHDLVGAGRPRRRRRDPRDPPVDAAEHRQRVASLQAGVVGDLVVGQERGVDRRPPGLEVADDGLDLEVELDRGGERPQRRVGPAARDARPHVATPLACRLAPLDHHVRDGQDQRADHVVGVGEVGEVVAAEAVAPDVEHRAHRQQRARRVAGEDVRAAGAVVVQEPAPVGDPGLDRGRVARVVGDDRAAGVLLPPAERRQVAVVAVQDPGLAGAGLRRPVGLPAHEPMAALVDPARQRRDRAVAQRPSQHVVGQPVDLQHQQAGHVGRDRVARPGAPREVAAEAVLVVDRQQRRGQRGQRGHHHDRGRGVQDAVDRDARDDRRDGEQHDAVERQRAEADGGDRQRQCDPDEQRPQQRVERGRHDHRQDRGADAVDREAGQDPARQQQRERRDDDGPHPAADHRSSPLARRPTNG